MKDAQSIAFLNSQLAQRHLIPHAAHTVCAHGDHGVASLRTAGRLGRGDLGEGRGERVMLWSGAAEEPLDPQQEL